jgi:hypothetical protein
MVLLPSAGGPYQPTLATTTTPSPENSNTITISAALGWVSGLPVVYYMSQSPTSITISFTSGAALGEGDVITVTSSVDLWNTSPTITAGTNIASCSPAPTVTATTTVLTVTLTASCVVAAGASTDFVVTNPTANPADATPLTFELATTKDVTTGGSQIGYTATGEINSVNSDILFTFLFSSREHRAHPQFHSHPHVH